MGIAGNAGKGATIGSIVGGLGGFQRDRDKSDTRRADYQDQDASERVGSPAVPGSGLRV